MMSKRAQTRQLKNLQRQHLTNLTNASQQTSSLQQSLNDSQQSLSQNAMQELQQSSEFQNMSQEDQAELLEMVQGMEDYQNQSLSGEMPRTKRKYQRKTIGSGENGSDETLRSELIAPLTGKHLKQEKELKTLAGSVVLGLVAAAKASKSMTLAADAQTVARYGEEISHAWAVMGRKYSYIYDILDKICAGSVIAVALAPMSAMLGEIASNHGISIPIIGKHNKAA